MSQFAPLRSLADNGYLLAWILTGCEEGARAVLPEAAKEAARHPSAHDEDRKAKLFYACIRRRSIKFPARCELGGRLAGLHRSEEPGRTLLVCSALGALQAREAATVAGLDPRAAESLVASAAGALGSPEELREEAARLVPSEESAPAIEAARQAVETHWQHGAAMLRSPATIAVGVGFLLLIALVVWNLTGRSGTFPEDAVKIATEAARARPDEFTVLNIKTGDLPDWLAMQGHPELVVPAGLGRLEAVGLRSFKVEDERIAQVAVLDGERRLFFLSFDGRPLGISIAPEGTWRFAAAGSYSLAIRQDGGKCFLVQLKGTEQEMKDFLRESGTL